MKIVTKAQTLKESQVHGAATLFLVAVSELCFIK
jgi:hypothetical protein